MPKLAKELGPLAVSQVREAGLHFVGGVQGLALNVTAGTGRSWVLRVMIAGRRRDMGLGAYPGVTLAKAREKARAENTGAESAGEAPPADVEPAPDKV